MNNRDIAEWEEGIASQACKLGETYRALPVPSTPENIEAYIDRKVADAVNLKCAAYDEAITSIRTELQYLSGSLSQLRVRVTQLMEDRVASNHTIELLRSELQELRGELPAIIDVLDDKHATLRERLDNISFVLRSRLDNIKYILNKSGDVE